MTNGLRTVLPRSFNAATERVEVPEAGLNACMAFSIPAA